MSSQLRPPTVAELREKRDRESKQKLIDSCCFPPIYKSIEIGNLNQVPDSNKRQIAVYLKEYPNLPLKGLYLYSNSNGTGKTSLGVLTIKGLIRHGKVARPCFFIDYAALIAEARQAYNQSSDYSQSPIVDRALTAQIVMVDEFAMHKTTEFVADFVRYFVNTLYQNEVPIILTSNISMDERLVEALSFMSDDDHGQYNANAIVSRLKGMCNLIEVKTKADFREGYGRE